MEDKKDRRKVIEKEEYTQIFFDIFNLEDNKKFWKNKRKEINKTQEEETLEEVRKKRNEQKSKWAKRKELTTLHLIKKVKEDYKIDYEGIISYMWKLEDSAHYSKQMIKEKYVSEQETLKKYLSFLSNINLEGVTLNDIFESFVYGFISILIKYYGSLKNIEKYEGLRIIAEQYILIFGIRPHVLLDIQTHNFWIYELGLNV